MVEFLEKEHIYLVDGVITPSVTQILEKLFPDKYKGIPEDVLQRKASYGSVMHKYIEQYEKGIITIDLNYIQEASFNQYIKLKDKYNIEVLEQEQVVHYRRIYAGTFDMIAKVGKKKYLIDIKTTATLDKEYLSWQLSLYEKAYGKQFDGLACIWLPKKDLGQFVEIERKSRNEIKKLLEAYKNDKR